MARKNIFDILSQKMDINYEISRLNNLCTANMIVENGLFSYKLEDFVDRCCLVDWKNRNRCISCKEIRELLSITDFDIKHKLREEQIYAYLEYLANMIWLCDNYVNEHEECGVTKEYYLLDDNLLEIVESLNCELRVFEDDERVLLVEKNASVTAVVEIVDPKTAYEVIQYNHHSLKGNIAEKQRILKALSDKIEPIRAEFKKLQKHKDLESDVGYLLNKMNIRHNNVEGKNTIPYCKYKFPDTERDCF